MPRKDPCPCSMRVNNEYDQTDCAQSLGTRLSRLDVDVFYSPVYWLCIAALFCCLLMGIPAASAQDNLQTSDAAAPAVGSISARDITVKEGDTLRSIARTELGRTGFAPLLAEFNNLVESAPLVQGNVIRVPVFAPARDEYAEVIFVKGDVRLLRSSSAQATAQASVLGTSIPDPLMATATALERLEKIYSGDTIVTREDGYASVTFSNGSLINLQPGSTVILERLSCLESDDSCVVRVITQSGKVSADVDVRDNQPVEFIITTPYASAAVRGTEFAIDADENLKVGVTEGIVEIAAEQESVDVEAGYGVVVEPGQAPSQPIELLPPPVFKAVPARLAGGDTVAWWPLQAVQTYVALLSADEAASEAFATFEITEDRIGFDAIEPGDYYLTLSAIDDNGIEGFTSNTRVTIADIDTDVEPVSTSVTRNGSEYLVAVADGPDFAAGYEIQISSDESFTDPLSVDVNERGQAIFRIDSNQIFARARILLDPYSVSAFGEATSSQ
ncbi:MAG: FecR domain-containing protein [Granulosicoccus sp.]